MPSNKRMSPPESADTACSQHETHTFNNSAHQPSPAWLAQQGVKVRDFAYENPLSPIAPVPRLPRQIQPAPNGLKRRRSSQEDAEAENSAHASSPRRRRLSNAKVSSSVKKPTSLERKKTEPLEEEEDSSPNPSPSLHATHSSRLHVRGRRLNLVRQPTEPLIRETPGFPTTPLMPAFIPQSQASDWVDTPLITPEASMELDVEDASCIPASQLDMESQAPIMDAYSYSQLGMSPGFSQPVDSPVQRTGSPFHPSNASPPSPSQSLETPNSSPLSMSRRSTFQASIRLPERPPIDIRSSNAVSPPYILRRRSLLSTMIPIARSRYPQPHIIKSAFLKEGASSDTSSRSRRIRRSTAQGIKASIIR
ncbi:hypothetical protein CONPUDRAFT_153175 [Coniophora puteana RWD-64-598 SS2]|uniref:Uncharacterized protein n=1 Tax=Coniophora puteana (strain RWD-64-598) TaxID=741705 RepID=A0A5M3MUL4_CONPW|nr:uncharacterized protein CONPUDRAFT_153175 [Coniophora puteana RWD-64-598 SS2]EIW82291.1 hypothetical protein CONPUDRAFT_153175 [Coniophora puteana RWD-64-598 SS2]